MTQKNLITFFRTNPPERAILVVKNVLANPDLDQKVKIIALHYLESFMGAMLPFERDRLDNLPPEAN